MNFSEYTLLSVGDSFAFGQGTIEHYHVKQGLKQIPDAIRQEWKTKCNSHCLCQAYRNYFGFQMFC